MTLDRLAAVTAARDFRAQSDLKISRLVYDSRIARSGDALFCLVGARTDGHQYARSAYDAGCRVFVVSRPLDLPADAHQILTHDTRAALADASCAFYGDPASSLLLIGVTGTKGKTTTSCMICDALSSSGVSVGYIGTNGARLGEWRESVANTTPESHELHRIFRTMLDRGAEAVVLEVSSQAVASGRIRGLSFDVGVFTNLSPDHIGPGEHPDFESYRTAKAEFFSRYCRRSIIYNKDDPASSVMISSSRADRKLSCSIASEESDFFAHGIAQYRREGAFGSTLLVSNKEDGSERSLAVSIPGDFNVSNALEAYAAAKEALAVLGRDSDGSDLARGIANAELNGRFEVIERAGRCFVIDYAHNGKSLTSALELLRRYSPERLICLFGSVGGRTYMRRAELAAAASRSADMCIITSDNPDFEEPSKIIGEIYSHFAGSGCPAVCIEDRADAIEYAVSNSREGDIVLIAGKGHEKYQLVRGERRPFCERDILLALADRYLGAVTKM